MTEIGQINPNARVEVAWNPDSELIPVARSSGILSALSVPQGGLIAGRAAMMRLDGWTWEDLLLEPDVAMVINWPKRRTASYRDEAEKADKNEKERLERLKVLDQALDEAEAWIRARDAESEKGIGKHATDVRHDALRKVLTGEMPVLVGADEASDIRDVVAWALHRKLKLVIVGGARADLVSELLAEHRIPVILTHVNSLSWKIPYQRHAGFDVPFTLPARLHAAGVPIAIAGAGGGWGAAVSRNIPEIAARAASYGLPPEEALRAITLNPARFFGVDDRIGSIEPGKAATLFICDGDILEITSRVESAFIEGREVDLNDKQKMLYEKYRAKYRQLGLIE
jgi:imidazolonepropionase-like amidohydrolase